MKKKKILLCYYLRESSIMNCLVKNKSNSRTLLKYVIDN